MWRSRRTRAVGASSRRTSASCMEPAYLLVGRDETSGLLRREDRVHGPPAVPRDDGAPRTEPVALDFEVGGRQRLGQLPDPAVAGSDAEIAGRPHVEAPELEHQEHLGGPPADPPHAGELSDDVVVAPTTDRPEPNVARSHSIGEIDQGAGLGARQSGGAKPLLPR